MEQHLAAPANTKHAQISGPLFDAYGLKWLLIPGYIGLVASLMAFSVSTGVCGDFLYNTACLEGMKAMYEADDSIFRVLPVLSKLRCSRGPRKLVRLDH